MIRRISESEFPLYFQQLKVSVKSVLPVLGFAPKEMDQFVNTVILNQKQRQNNVSWLFENDDGQKACIGGEIEYIVPSSWADRHRIIKEALHQFKMRPDASERSFRIGIEIDEGVPSHNAYFTALLPELGFELFPQITFRADMGVVEQLECAALPAGFCEIPFNEKNRQLFTEGFKDIGGNTLSEELVKRRSGFLYDYYTSISVDVQRKTWVGILHQNRVVGFCFGNVLNGGGKLSIAEVAVSQDLWGKGLGRFMIIRCMQKLKEHYGQKGTHFVIDARRDNIRACRLYFGLGFERAQVTTRAIYHNDRSH